MRRLGPKLSHTQHLTAQQMMSAFLEEHLHILSLFTTTKSPTLVPASVLANLWSIFNNYCEWVFSTYSQIQIKTLRWVLFGSLKLTCNLAGTKVELRHTSVCHWFDCLITMDTCPTCSGKEVTEPWASMCKPVPLEVPNLWVHPSSRTIQSGVTEENKDSSPCTPSTTLLDRSK